MIINGVDALDSIRKYENEKYLEPVIEILKSGTGLNFSYYKHELIARRLNAWFDRNGIKKPERYMSRLKGSIEEQKKLAKSLLIGITGFFREPEAAGFIKDEILTGYLDRETMPDEIKIWVPACSTGEEAYTLAILYSILKEQYPGLPGVKILATDVDSESIDTARIGVYPEDATVNIPGEYLEKYFRYDEGYYYVSSGIEEITEFRYDDALDSKIDMTFDIVSCRNLMIYLKPEYRRKLLSVFSGNMNENAWLILDPSESVPADDKTWLPVSTRYKAYRLRTRD